MRDFLDLIESRSATIGVVGLGYAGLPVAVAFAEAGFNVIGVDLDRSRVEKLRQRKSYVVDIPEDVIDLLVSQGRLNAHTEYAPLREANAILICDPTPLRDHHPDLSAVTAAGEGISEVLPQQCLVVLESTSYLGTTEGILMPLLDAGGRKVGIDYFLGFSPERTDPGNEKYAYRQIPKIVGGVTSKCGELSARLYQTVVDKVVTVSSPREAELAKLIENIFRQVNIALVNEMAIYAHDLNVNIWEAIDAAATKPFGFMPFYPGPGVGGHCVGIDPTYLSWRVKQKQGQAFRFIELADELNRSMPKLVVSRLAELLNESGKAINGSRILVIGVDYKPGVNDIRESPSLEIMGILAGKGANVCYHDPFVDSLLLEGKTFESISLKEGSLGGYDLVAILTPHPSIDYALLRREYRLIFDARNAPRGLPGPIVQALQERA